MKYKLAIICILLTSCVSNRVGDVEFFINKNRNIQYFFPSTWWEINSDEVKFEADFLYKDYATSNLGDIAFSIMNFTMHSSSTLFRDIPQKLTMYNESYSLYVPVENIDIIFIDKDKTRFTAKIKTTELNKLFQSAEDKIKISFEMDQNFNLESSEGFKKHIAYYREVILGIKTIDY